MVAVASEAPAADRLARFYAALMAPSLPEATRHAVRRHLLDTLGAALAGSARPEPQAALQASNLLHNAPGIGAIWGASHRAPAEVAALVNGTVSDIEVGVHPTIVKMCGGTSAASLVDAQMSLPYAVSVGWLHGDAGLPQFADAVRASAAIADWLPRVRVVADPAVDSNIAARLTVRSHAGLERTLRIDVPIGSWNRPLPDAELVAKYRSLATPVLGGARAAALESAVMGLRRGTDVAALPDLLTTPDERGRLA